MTLSFSRLLVIFMLCVGAVTHDAKAQDSYTHAKPSLTAQYSGIDGSESFYVMLTLDIEKHWHSYWLNPGDSGLETSVNWGELPEGVALSPMIWLPPKRLHMPPLTNYGYEDTAQHLFEVTMPREIPDEGITLTGKASWLVCKEICIPERATVSVTFEKAESNIASPDKPAIDAALSAAALPFADAELTDVNKKNFQLTFTPELPENTVVKDAYFFPQEPSLIEHAASQLPDISDKAVALTLVRGYAALPEPLIGVLELTTDTGAILHYKTAISPEAIPEDPTMTGSDIPAAEPVYIGNQPQEPAKPAARSLAVLLFFAFIGGVILNAMPCVFPVLSLKAISISKKADAAPGKVRMNGISYTLGVLAGFAIAGGALLALKATGQSAGWGFQMQSPLFVTGMALLLFLVGLNLAGYFDIRFIFGGNSKAANEGGNKGAFFTGLLAAAVATPCTAPFMATALGAALALPYAHGMAIFLALGFGLAFPYLLLTFIPALTRRMPRPGAWMEKFRHVLSYPMFISAVWLMWVLMQQIDVDDTALVMLAGVCAAGALRILQGDGLLRRPIALLVCLLFMAGTAVPFVKLYHKDEAAERQTDISYDDITVPYDAAALATLEEEGKSVFVYATAAWCITCKVNERIALRSNDVLNLFKAKNVTVMRADWTNEDAHITDYLERFGRNGVPLYVYYAGEGAKPVVLPQLLTPAIVGDYVK